MQKLHRLLITDPAGVVINTKTYALGEIVPGVPRGIANTCVYFKQAKDLDAPSAKSAPDEKGNPLEVFARKLKAFLIEEYECDADQAANLITTHAHLVGLGALGGAAALKPTAVSLIQAANAAVGVPTPPLSPHPASRLARVPGVEPAVAGPVVVTNQPLAGESTGGDTDEPTALQQANADKERAEVAAGAVEKKTGAKTKSGK